MTREEALHGLNTGRTPHLDPSRRWLEVWLAPLHRASEPKLGGLLADEDVTMVFDRLRDGIAARHQTFVLNARKQLCGP